VGFLGLGILWLGMLITIRGGLDSKVRPRADSGMDMVFIGGLMAINSN
jgi:hypothetical protein